MMCPLLQIGASASFPCARIRSRASPRLASPPHATIAFRECRLSCCQPPPNSCWPFRCPVGRRRRRTSHAHPSFALFADIQQLLCWIGAPTSRCDAYLVAKKTKRARHGFLVPTRLPNTNHGYLQRTLPCRRLFFYSFRAFSQSQRPKNADTLTHTKRARARRHRGAAAEMR